MDMIPLKPERKAQLEEYARQRGQDPATALDDALTAYLEWERQGFSEAVEGIGHGYEDVRAGRTRPASEFLAEMRRKHDIPGWSNGAIEREKKELSGSNQLRVTEKTSHDYAIERYYL